MESKVLLLDIDGVLLNQEDDTKPKVWAELKKLISRGISVSFVTARPYGLSAHLIDKLGTKSGIHIFENGNFIYEPSKQEIHGGLYLDSQTSQTIMDVVSNQLDHIRFGYSQGKVFFANLKYFNELIGYMPKIAYDLFESFDNKNKISFWVKDIHEIIGKELTSKLGNEITIYSYEQRDHLFSFFIHPKSGNKLEGVKILSKSLGVRLADMVFIGDDTKDVELAKSVGLSFAPLNATDDMKQAATFVSTKLYSEVILDAISRLWS
ncbi:hypothetical protein A2368_01910 [Candidatus Collierbacteria bacterium RIFOXYB1_FULL_49_13]|uniref:Uncharacterized protein n=1 Tax=Candidatus Collierbacteria bacterium RIFOXYB1_FULL_49_13 TaxID=1817728 RepID=A0A1F5FGA6_9BACT|nr:MAG: hypothetical protein A2368_01910 [Candidatus Collierbacteria bacterium RIFOXYB1_FULL_49_13]